MQLSWDMNLNNGLHIVGDKSQCWIPIGPLDTVYTRKTADAEWQTEKVRVKWPLDATPQHGRQGCPVDYDECFLFQLVQTVRAIRLGESTAATGEDGLSTMRIIENAYKMAKPLVKPWLSSEEQSRLGQHHWRNQAI
jgi:predicted dehydrogenase